MFLVGILKELTKILLAWFSFYVTYFHVNLVKCRAILTQLPLLNESTYLQLHSVRVLTLMNVGKYIYKSAHVRKCNLGTCI